MKEVIFIIEILLFIICSIVSIILMMMISNTLKSKGYHTSFFSNPIEIINYFRVIKNEKKTIEKLKLLGLLFLSFSSTILTFYFAFLIF